MNWRPTNEFRWKAMNQHGEGKVLQQKWEGIEDSQLSVELRERKTEWRDVPVETE